MQKPSDQEKLPQHIQGKGTQWRTKHFPPNRVEPKGPPPILGDSKGPTNTDRQRTIDIKKLT